MLDYRAWIIAGLILLAALGGYIIWITRPRAQYNARSLSASGHPATATDKSGQPQPVTKSLHVDGCKDDFIVSPGEIVEPRVVPGASLDQFRSVYGDEKPDKKNPDALVWRTDEFELLANKAAPGEPGNLIQMSLNSGHIVETLDGIELGLDSFGTIFRKMQDKKVEIHQRIRREGDHWILTVSIYSACGRKFRSEYFRSLPSDPETDALINRRETGSDGKPGPLRSDIFMNKVVYDYILETSDGKDDDPTAGEPSERD
jgi:hypothetical protein